ncbi:MAG: hypothetical protein D6689_12785 [Deltaproteobacteria bacterium]|nr:MAG: hypothetical protein D6689_12785 [Deltaproteobacteria bacterium]
MIDVALATCRRKPEPDPDEQPLLAALAARGLRAAAWAWDDPSIDWSGARLVVLRSTWNYADRPDAFVAWVAATARATRLCNGADIVRANVHKRYLLALERAGVAIAPTVLVPRGDAASVADIAARRGWPSVVVKPAVSAASRQTARFDDPASPAADAHLHRVLATGDALVQRYLPSTETEGERALVWIDGAFTHSVRKAPRFSGDSESVGDPRPLTDEERALGDAALAAAPRPLVYARVDVARRPDGQLAVMELELMEPSLFLREWPAALDRFADAIARRARP